MFAASEHHVATSKMDFVVFQIVLTNRARGRTTFVIKDEVLVTKVHGQSL